MTRIHVCARPSIACRYITNRYVGPGVLRVFGSNLTIIVVVGIPGLSYSGDGGAAILAGTNNPQGLAYDCSSRTMYLADTVRARTL